MIKYIDHNTIKNFLKPIYKFLLILNILLIVVLILDTFQIINLDFWSWILYLVLLAAFHELTIFNKFDNNYSLNLKYKWQIKLSNYLWNQKAK